MHLSTLQSTAAGWACVAGAAAVVAGSAAGADEAVVGADVVDDEAPVAGDDDALAADDVAADGWAVALTAGSTGCAEQALTALTKTRPANSGRRLRAGIDSGRISTTLTRELHWRLAIS